MTKFEVQDPNFLPHCGCSLSLPLEEGKVLVIYGSNGIGKTTLLKRINEGLGERKTSALVEQGNPDSFYDRKLGNFKKIFLRAASGKIIEKRFHHLWNSWGLGHKEDRKLSALSGGEGQMLKLVCGLSINANFILLDEPSQSLDDQKKAILKNTVNELLSEGRGVIIVDHVLGWMDRGWFVQALRMEEETLTVGETWII